MKMTEKHHSRECKYFYWDRDGYPICGRCGLCCSPTDDEKCPDAVWKDEEEEKTDE